MVGRRQVLAGMGGLLATIVGELRLLGNGRNATARGPIGTNGDARLVGGFLLLDDGELYAGPIVAPPSDLVPRLENLSDGSVESGFRIDHLPQGRGVTFPNARLMVFHELNGLTPKAIEVTSHVSGRVVQSLSVCEAPSPRGDRYLPALTGRCTSVFPNPVPVWPGRRSDGSLGQVEPNSPYLPGPGVVIDARAQTTAMWISRKWLHIVTVDRELTGLSIAEVLAHLTFEG